MNEGLHRVVFNPSQGMRVAVQETASSAGKSGDTTCTRSGAQAAGSPRLCRTLVSVACATLMWNAAQAQVVVDSRVPGAQQPVIGSASNGATLVNITAPSAAGVSRNSYKQFDVGTKGVILNNANAAVQTQLGGRVNANAALARGSAKVILNEVNSTSKSRLAGALEVAGAKADVVVANPSGIVVDGASFINAGGVTLTTGTAQLDARGALTGVQVNTGTITVQGKGLRGDKADYVNVLARAVEVNAAIWADDLRVVTGGNQLDARGHVVKSAKTNNKGGKPKLALDVSELGGMYASKIHVVGTEAGMGVRNAGQLNSNANLALNVNGDLTNAGALKANGNVDVAANAVANAGSIASGSPANAGAGITVSAKGQVQNSGLFKAVGNVDVSAQAVANAGGRTTGANVTVKATRDIQLLGGSIEASTSMLVKADRDIVGKTTTKTIKNLGGIKGALSTALEHETQLKLTSPGGKSLELSAGRDLQLNGSVVQNLSTNGKTIVKAGKDIALGVVHLANATGAVGNKNLFDRQSIKEELGTRIQSKGDVFIDAGRDLLTRAADLDSSGTLALQAKRTLDITAGLRNAVEEQQKTGANGATQSTLVDSSAAVASTLKARDLQLSAGRDIAVLGSQLKSERDAVLTAARNVTLDTVKESIKETIGSASQLNGVKEGMENIEKIASIAPSLIDSATGNVTINAGNAFKQVGSAVLAAKGDILANAKDIAIAHADRVIKNGTTIKSGETLNKITDDIGGWLGSKGGADKKPTNWIGTGISAIKDGIVSKLDAHASADTLTSVGSNLVAGGNIRLQAVGGGSRSNALIRASEMEAGSDIQLVADNKISLLASDNSTTSKLSRGIFTVLKGSEKDHASALLNAGKNVQLQSGGNADLTGALVAANHVAAKIGGNLQMESLQGSSTVGKSLESVAGNIANALQLDLRAAPVKNPSDADVIHQQTGIFAGDGGYDIAVKGKSNLVNAVISSTQKAIDKQGNRFTTGSITMKDILEKFDSNSTRKAVTQGTQALQKIKGSVVADVGKVVAKAASKTLANHLIEKSVVTDAASAKVKTIHQLQKTGKDIAAFLGAVDGDSGMVHQIADKVDLPNLSGNLADKGGGKNVVGSKLADYADTAYTTMFDIEHPIYRIERNANGTVKMQVGADGVSRPVMRKVTATERANLQAGRDGKVHVSANGIMATAEDAAAYVARQNPDKSSTPMYLVYFPKSDNLATELIIAGYQKLFDNPAWGLTNSTDTVANLAKDYGNKGLELGGFSRGTLTVGNALNAMVWNGQKGVMNNASVTLIGSPYNAFTAAALLDTLSDGRNRSVTLHNHSLDFIGTVIGGNPASSSLAPEGTSAIGELWNTLLLKDDAVHMCYASDNPGCSGFGLGEGIKVSAK